MLISLLDSHPDVLCAGEIFSPGSGSEYAIGKLASSSTRNRLRHQLTRSALVEEFLENYYAQPGYKAIGFKFMYSHARHLPRLYPSALQHILQNKIPVIHNIRENKLRVVLSRVASKSSGVYRSEKPVAREPLVLPTKGLLKELTKLKQEDESWAAKFTQQPYLKVVYESLLKDSAGENLRLQQFIDVEHTDELSTSYVKLNTGSVESMLKNFDEVERELSNTEFEWCLSREIP